MPYDGACHAPRRRPTQCNRLKIAGYNVRFFPVYAKIAVSVAHNLKHIRVNFILALGFKNNLQT